MSDDPDWFTALPQPVRAAALVDPGAVLPPGLIARLPRLYRSTYGTTSVLWGVDVATAICAGVAGSIGVRSGVASS
jgi:hypothetical protein